MLNNKWVADLKTVLQVAKERYTVADYIRNNKVPRARISKCFRNN